MQGAGKGEANGTVGRSDAVPAGQCPCVERAASVGDGLGCPFRVALAQRRVPVCFVRVLRGRVRGTHAAPKGAPGLRSLGKLAFLWISARAAFSDPPTIVVARAAALEVVPAPIVVRIAEIVDRRFAGAVCGNRHGGGEEQGEERGQGRRGEGAPDARL